jgi:cell wall assembly regulator SMI1
MADIVWKYVKSLVNDTAIDDFERKFGIQFPDDLKKCLKMNNGGRPILNVFDTKESQERVMGSLLSFNIGDSDNIYSVFSVLQKENKNCLPFARDPAGNFLCTLQGKVVFWLHETNTYEYVAESFTAFLEKLYV